MTEPTQEEDKRIPLLNEIIRPGRGRKGAQAEQEPKKPIVREIIDPSVGSVTEIVDAKAHETALESVPDLSRLGVSEQTSSPINKAQQQQLGEELAEIVQKRLDHILPKLAAQITKDLQQHVDKRLQDWQQKNDKNR